jgi:hypothetical protein
VCRDLGADTWWGDGPEAAPRERPAAFDGLTPLGEGRFRCPNCGTQYQHQHSSNSFLNADYETDTLHRVAPAEYPVGEREQALDRLLGDLRSPEREVREAAASTHARGSLRCLDAIGRDLLDIPDEAVRVAALKTVKLALGGAVKDLGVLEPWLRGMCADASTEVQRRSGYLLAWHLIRSGRVGEALALLAGSSGAVAAGALGAIWVNLAQVDVQALLPALRRCLRRPEADVQSEADRLVWRLVRLGSEVDRLANASRRQLSLAALADWSEAGDAQRFASNLVVELVRGLADQSEAIRRDAFRTLCVAVDRGLKVAPTMDALAGTLCAVTWPGEEIPGLADRLTRLEASFEPLVVWLTLLARRQPAEAVAGLEELARRGTDLSTASETLHRLGAQAADPGVRQRAQALLAMKP